MLLARAGPPIWSWQRHQKPPHPCLAAKAALPTLHGAGGVSVQLVRGRSVCPYVQHCHRTVQKAPVSQSSVPKLYEPAVEPGSMTSSPELRA